MVGGLHALVQFSRLNKVFTLPYLCRISVMQKTAAKSLFAKNFSHQQYLAKEEYREKQKHYEVQVQGYTKNMKISLLSLNRNLVTPAKQQ
jgi:hypothetical protein